MAKLPTQRVTSAGLSPAFQNADAAGDTFDPGCTLRIKNGSAAATNHTVNSVRPCNQGFDHDVVINVPAGGDVTAGPFDDRFTGPSGLVTVTHSAAAGVSVAALK